MPLGSTFLDKYNQANITLLRQLQKADKQTAETFFGNQCDGASYTSPMSSAVTAERTALNKYAIWDPFCQLASKGAFTSSCTNTSTSTKMQIKPTFSIPQLRY